MASDVLSKLNTNGSGLNLAELANSLVDAETVPKINAAQNAREEAELAISAYGTLRSSYQSLDSTLSALTGAEVLQANSTSSNVSLTVDDRTVLSEGTTTIDVAQIAQRQVLEFTGFASADDTIGTGELTVEVGVWFGDTDFAANPDFSAETITIGEGATLGELADALSSLDGVTARVLDRGDGTFTLGVVSELGAGQAIRMTANETTPGLSTFDNTLTNSTVQVQAAQDAMVTVDGITVFRDSNEIDDIVPGATLTLTGTTDTPAEVSIGRDMELAYGLLEGFVAELNSTIQSLKDITNAGLEGDERGALAGDRTAVRLMSDLMNTISGPLSGHGDRNIYLADLGVATERDGSLSMNRMVFERAFNSDPTTFDALFQNSFGSETDGVEVSGTVGRSAQSGSYSFLVNTETEIATLNGQPLLTSNMPDGRVQYVSLSGSLSGMVITAPSDVTSAEVSFGRSLVSKLQDLMTETLQSAGTFDSRENTFRDIITEQDQEIKDLNARVEVLEQRYIERFAAMERAITELNSTGAYLTNLIESWNSD